MAKVKICGITNPKDADKAVEYGADALGFIFYDKSPRNIAPDRARAIIADLPPFVLSVGVFVDASETAVRKIRAGTGISVLQFHGQESPSFCSAFSPHGIKAVRIQGGGWMDLLAEYRVSGFLLDGFYADDPSVPSENKHWVQVRKAARTWKVILAGGLTPANVAQAIDLVDPYAVDVARGVEIKPGMKDWVRMKDFIQRAKETRSHGQTLPAA